MPAPVTFQPLYMERVWGGRRLAELFGRRLPEGVVVGESWELVDREEAQSVVDAGEHAGRTLHDLWTGDRELFGARSAAAGERFPLLVKLLDCEQTLSVQVHPRRDKAIELGGEPKTEMWVVLHATDDAHLFAGLRAGVTRAAFEQALADGEDVSALLHRIDVHAGDVMFLQSGRVHAIGAGNVIAEIQQSSDTTYRVFDFNRLGLDGKPRELHVPESLASIDWDDIEPDPIEPHGEELVHGDLFEVDRFTLDGERTAAPDGECAIVCALHAEVRCGDRTIEPGRFFLVPAGGPPLRGRAEVLRVMLG